MVSPFKKILGILILFFSDHYNISKKFNVVLKEVMSKYKNMMLIQLSQLLHVDVCIDVEDIYRILTLHTLIAHLISVFEVWEAKVEVL